MLAFSCDPATELAEGHQRHLVGQRAEVGEERRERGREVAGVVHHPAPLDGAEVGVHVPVALVDGEHLDADVAADHPGRVGQRAAEVAAGVRRAVRRRRTRRLTGSNPSTAVERRRASRGPAGWCRRPQRVERAAPCPVVPLVVAGDLDLVDVARPTSPARARRATPARRRSPTPKPCSGERSPSVPIRRFSQPTRVAEPGSASSTSSIAAKCERLGAGSPVACTAASLPASTGAPAARAPGAGRTARPWRPAAGRPGPRCRGRGLVVDRVGVRHHERQPVGGAAQRQHHQHRARPAAAAAARPSATAEPNDGAWRRRRRARRASRPRRVGRRTRGSRAGGRWGHRAHLVRKAGESRKVGQQPRHRPLHERRGRG